MTEYYGYDDAANDDREDYDPADVEQGEGYDDGPVYADDEQFYDPAEVYDEQAYEPAADPAADPAALFVQAQQEVAQWLDAIGEGRALNAIDRELICEAALEIQGADPSLGLGEALAQGFQRYRSANETSWARATENELVSAPGERVTPKGGHDWYADLNRRELVRTTDEGLRAYGQSTSMREANELAAWRLATARRMDEGAAPAIDLDQAREIARDACRGDV